MVGIETFSLLLGLALCAGAFLGVGSWVGHAVISSASAKKVYEESTRSLREVIRLRALENAETGNAGNWKGYRDFRVAKIVRESVNSVSLYLVPEDGKPIPDFKPGQHVTLRFEPRGKAKPQVRCYSLSCGPGKPFYRITVKHLADRGDNKGPGTVSTIINQETKVGDRIPVKAPSGHFHLDETSKETVVLLAGGIGVTPMVSMLDRIIDSNRNRIVVLVYGVRNSSEHPFREYLAQAATAYENVHVVNCYSQPGPDDVKGVHYQVEGLVSIELLKSILPNNQCEFYLCGPPAFMESLHGGLENWGVPDTRISFEQFGPSTVKKSERSVAASSNEPDPVSFVESGELALWNSNYESILEMAEANDVPIESGCRSGSCGTCETAIVSGKVQYDSGADVQCNPGCCLPCIATPDGPLELEA